MARFWSADYSSLKEMPPYLTVGDPCTHPDGPPYTAQNAARWVRGPTYTSTQISSMLDDIPVPRRNALSPSPRSFIKGPGQRGRWCRKGAKILKKLFKVTVERVDRSPFVCTYHHICALNAWERARDYLDHGRSSMPLDRGYIRIRLIHSSIGRRRLPEGTDKYRMRIQWDRDRRVNEGEVCSLLCEA